MLLVAPVLAAIRARNGKVASRLVTVGSGAIVLAGGFWFVRRMWFGG